MGQTMKQYLALQRSLGLLLEAAEYTLDDFDQYLAVHFPKVKRVTRKMVMGYLATTRHLHSTSRRDALSILRQFCRFLFHLNPRTYIPQRNLLPPGKVKVRPHIYSEIELQNILRFTRQLGPHGSLRPHTLTTIFSLLWVSGMRISEVLNLNLADVDLEDGVIHIQQTKFSKSRLIPLSSSSIAALLQYRDKRARYGHSHSSGAPFFVNKLGKRCSLPAIQEVFWRGIQKLGIKTVQGGRPRIHDFRHSFATRWLNEFYRSGKDPCS
jgi:integrase